MKDYYFYWTDPTGYLCGISRSCVNDTDAVQNRPPQTERVSTDVQMSEWTYGFRKVWERI